MTLARSGRRVTLDGFEANLAFLFGTGFADPDHTATDGVQFIIAGDDLDHLPTLEPEAAPQAEALRRTVHNEAGNPMRLRTEVNHHAGSLSHGDTFRAAAIVSWEGGHCFVLDEEFHNTPIMG